MATKIKPSDLPSLKLVQYNKILEKDFARISKQNKLIDYLFVKGYKFDGKKSNLLLFANVEDPMWKNAADVAKGKGKKNATGKCKVIKSKGKGEEKDRIVIAIKTANGDLSKNKVIETINDDMFKDDVWVQACLDGEEGNLAKDSLPGKDVKLTDGTHFAEDATLKNKTGKDAEESAMIPFVKALDNFFKEIVSLDALSTEVKGRVTKIQKLYEDHVEKDDYKEEVLPIAQDAVNYINGLVAKLEDITKKGDYWLKEKGDLFAKSVRSKDKVTRHEKKVKETEKQVAQAKKIMRQLVQNQDTYYPRIPKMIEKQYL